MSKARDSWFENNSSEDKPVQFPAVNWSRIEKFVGYGRPDARVVFIGMEEGLDKDADLDFELRLRSQFSQVMDLRDACRGVPGAEAIFDPNRGYRQPVWRAVAFLMAWRKLGRIPSAEECRHYRAAELGQTGGDVVLAELLPYPHPKSADWLYACRFDSRVEYELAMLSSRVNILRKFLQEFPRELIVCYGKSRWADFEKLFSGVEWFEREPFRVGAWQGTRLMFTGHFSAPEFNSNESLHEFAEVALGE